MRTETEKLPMSGVRVIDVGTFLAGPYAASILGEFGAEILKVEHPIAGDPMRRFGTPTKRHDATLAWLSEGRNRKSVTIDLRQKEGVELFLKLVAKSHVLVENFRPGTIILDSYFGSKTAKSIVTGALWRIGVEGVISLSSASPLPWRD